MKTDDQITVVITAYNESSMLKGCIESAHNLTDQIILVDTESTDDTVSIAKNMGVETHTFPFDKIVEPSRNFAIGKVKSGWVFILDADERIDKELATEIKQQIQVDKYTYYKIPRQNVFAKKWPMLHGGWWPDYVTRLIKRDSFVNWPEKIHSTPKINGEMGYLTKSLKHYSQGDLSVMVEKTILFENMESDLLHKAGRKSSTPLFFRKFLAEFYRRAIRNKGLLDGPAGLIASLYQAFSKTITYLLLYEKNTNH